MVLRRLFDYDRANAAGFTAFTFDCINGLNRDFGACPVVDLPSRRCRRRRWFHWAATRAHPTSKSTGIHPAAARFRRTALQCFFFFCHFFYRSHATARFHRTALQRCFIFCLFLFFVSHLTARFHRTDLQRCFFICLIFFRRHALRRLFDYGRSAAAGFAAFDCSNGLNRDVGACPVVEMLPRRCRRRRRSHWAATRAHSAS